MNTAKKYIVSACFVLLVAGCAQTKVQQPPQQDRTYDRSSQISEQTIEPAKTMVIEDQTERLPVPFQKPLIGFPQASTGVSEEKVLPSMDYVNDRIFEYGRKLDRWKELDDQSLVMSLTEEQTENMVRCFRDLQKVLNSYGRLHDDLLQRNVIAESDLFSTRDVLDLQKMDIAFLDSVCGRMLGGPEDKAAGWQQRQKKADLNQIETLIERYSSNKEYDEVVQVWLQIPEYQVDRVDLKTRILYGNALIYLDQQEKAAEIYQQIVDEMSVSKEQPTDLLSLRKILADLYTASSNYLAAEGQYNQISNDYLNIGQIEEWSKLQLSILDRSSKGSPELTEYSRLLRNYLGFRPEEMGYTIVWEADKFLQDYPYSPVTSNVDVIKADALAKADKWFADFFTQVDNLVAEKKFQDAMELLQTIPEEVIGPEKILEIKAKTDELVLAEAVERETLKIERMQDLQRRWNEGMVLADNDDFDGAIAVFTALLDTEYSSKAQVKIEELTLQAAKADRREAAELFIRFTKTTDLEAKKKLLIESRSVLKQILVKYPDVEIAQKVKGNIDRVENEMNALDPMLLPVIEKKEAVRRTTDEPGVAPVGLDAFDLPVEKKDTPSQPLPSQQVPVLTPQDVQQ